MYSDFYGLTDKPFTVTPSSRFLYLGEVHKEALALLTYGVLERKEFILLTGDVGTGKTTVIQALLNKLGKDVKTVLLSNPLLSPQEFIDHLTLHTFRKRVRFESKAEFLFYFEEFLRRCFRKGLHFVLIVDEAHKLSFELLEEIRLLSNMQELGESLISIFLAGQPELNEKLRDPRCRALLQRITMQYHISPLDAKETVEYVNTRLKLAGAKNGSRIFPSDAIRAIYEHSRGYPRVINILADNALLLGYSRGTPKVTRSMVEESYEDLKLKPGYQETALESPKPQDAAKKARSQIRKNWWKWAAVLLMIIIGILLFSLSPPGKSLLKRFPGIILGVEQTHPGNVSDKNAVFRKKIDR